MSQPTVDVGHARLRKLLVEVVDGVKVYLVWTAQPHKYGTSEMAQNMLVIAVQSNHFLLGWILVVIWILYEGEARPFTGRIVAHMGVANEPEVVFDSSISAMMGIYQFKQLFFGEVTDGLLHIVGFGRFL